MNNIITSRIRKGGRLKNKNGTLNPIGYFAAYNNNGHVQFGYSLCRRFERQYFDNEFGSTVAVNRAKKGVGITEFPRGVKEQFYDFHARAKDYFKNCVMLDFDSYSFTQVSNKPKHVNQENPE